MEELVAELNAAFLSADLGLTPSSREEHAAYIAGLHGSSSGSAQPLPQRKRKRAAAILPQRSVFAVQRQRKGPRHAGCRKSKTLRVLSGHE